MATNQTIDPFPTDVEISAEVEKALNAIFSGDPSLSDLPANYKAGSIYQYLRAINLLQVQDIRNLFVEQRLNLTIETIEDEEILELLLLERGSSRKTATPSTVTMRIGVKALPADEKVTISQGIKVFYEDVKTDEIREFIYLEPDTITITNNTSFDENGYSTVDLLFTAEEPGRTTGYESIAVGKINQLDDTALSIGLDYCTNIVESSGGTDLETAEEMRYRLTLLEFSFDEWTDQWIKQQCLSVAGVTYCEVYKAWPPMPIALEIVLGGVNGAVTTSVQKLVYEKLMQDQNSSISFVIDTIKEQAINITLKVFYNNTKIDEAEILTVVTSFFDAMSESTDFVRDQLQKEINSKFLNIIRFDWAVDEIVIMGVGYKAMLGNFVFSQELYNG